MEADGLCLTFILLILGRDIQPISADLSDFGGDVRQYMSLLQGTSAFSFSPKDGKTLLMICLFNR